MLQRVITPVLYTLANTSVFLLFMPTSSTLDFYTSATILLGSITAVQRVTQYKLPGDLNHPAPCLPAGPVHYLPAHNLPSWGLPVNLYISFLGTILYWGTSGIGATRVYKGVLGGTGATRGLRGALGVLGVLPFIPSYKGTSPSTYFHPIL